MNRFGEILAELRRDRRMSQKELAVAFHISTSTISSYETGGAPSQCRTSYSVRAVF